MPPSAVPDRTSAPPFATLLGKSGFLHADIKNLVEKEYVKSSALKELIRHIVFLVIFIAALILNRSNYESYLMNQALINAFVTQQIDPSLQPFSTTFQDIGDPGQWADWLTNIVGGTLDQTQFYSGQDMNDTQRDYIMFSNRLLGGVRMRQLRAAPNKNCKLPGQLKHLTEIPGTCFDWDYGNGNKDTEPFGPPDNTTKYTYQTASECGSVSLFGNALTYLEGGGYLVDFPLALRDTNSSFTDAFQDVVDDTWVDVQTRAVIVTMNFLNLELESRIAVMYFILEMPGNGLFFPSVVIKTFRLNLYVTGLDYFRLFLEICVLLFVLYSWYSEIAEMVTNYRSRGLKKYFYNFWNIIELVDLVLYVTVIILYVKYIGSSGRYGVKLDSRFYFPELEQIAASALIFYNLASVNVIISTFRTFKYLRLNNRLYVLWKTLRYAGADLVGFLFIFLIIIFGFIFMGWVAFGQDLEEYNSISNSFGTCWNFIIGNVPDYGAMSTSNRVIGPFFFILFTIFIFFILANMFIAILSNSFEVVSIKEENTKLSDILEEKIESVIKAVTDAYYYVTNKGKPKKRSIVVLLDELAQPEILDRKSNLTRSDIERAIGPTATADEVDDLYRWVRKLEAKKAKKSRATFSEEDGAGDQESTMTISRDGTLARGLNLESEISTQVELREMKAQMTNLQGQVAELKELLQQLVAR